MNAKVNVVDKNVLKELEEKLGIKLNRDNMRKLGLLAKEKGYLTNAGVLFLCKNPSAFIPGAKVRIIKVRRELEEYEILADLDMPIWKLAEKAFKVVKEEFGYILEYKGGLKHKIMQKIPEVALREAIINALIHKNYYLPAEILIFIEKDKIEIKNAGGFPPGVTPKKPEHVARNPIICDLFFRMGFIEKFGSGIIRMKQDCLNKGLKAPEIETDGFTVVRLWLRVEKLEDRILEILSKGSYSSGEIAAAVKKSKPTVLKILKKLEKEGKIKSAGKGRYRKFYLA